MPPLRGTPFYALPPAARRSRPAAVPQVGKLFAAAKRQVLFKFAFEGDTDEHAVVLMHTINSGKKVLFVNGEEKHAEEKVRAGLFQPRAPRARAEAHSDLPPPPHASIPQAYTAPFL